MKNLLRAGWRGVRRDRVFWGCAGAMALSGLYILYLGALDRFRVWDAGAFNFLLAEAMVLPVFCPLVFGREYAHGTLRNKLVAGHSRLTVYFSCLALSCGTALLLALSYLVPFMGPSLIMGAGLSRDPQYVCAVAGCSVLVLLAVTAFFTTLSLLIQDRPWAVAVSLVLGFVMVVSGQYLKAKLGISEEWAATIRVNYPRGAYRAALRFLYDCTPGGMVFQCASLDVGSPGVVCLNAVLTGLASALLGAWGFVRKDLR